jgi:hypothetical protein
MTLCGGPIQFLEMDRGAPSAAVGIVDQIAHGRRFVLEVGRERS